MGGTQRWPLVALLTASVFTLSDVLPPLLSYLLVLAVFGVVVVVLLTRDRQRIAAPGYALLTVGGIWGVYLLHTVLNVAGGSVTTDLFLRLPIFVFVTGLSLFFVPQRIDSSVFLTTASRLGGALVLLGIPTLVIGAYGVGGVVIEPYRECINCGSVLGNEFYPIMSVFSNPNTLSFVAMVGVFGAGYEWFRDRSGVALGLAAVNLLGLYFSGSRAAIGGLVVGVAAAWCLVWFGRRVMQLLLVGGGALVLLVVARKIEIVTLGPAIPVSFAGRVWIWRGAIEAIAQQPVFGYGPGDLTAIVAQFMERDWNSNPHNSYLRMFLSTGIVGGTLYLVFVVRSLLGARPADGRRVAVFGTAVAIAVVQVFAGFSLFGLSLTSVMSALTFGYLIDPTTDGGDASVGTPTTRRPDVPVASTDGGHRGDGKQNG